MSDEPSFDFLPWEELPVGVRRNRKKMYNYLVSVLGGDTPTPTGTGTITINCQDSEGNPAENAECLLCSTNQIPTPQDDSNLVAFSQTGSDGTGTLALWDKETHQPTEVTDIPFGDYYLFVYHSSIAHPYESELTIDGDDELNISLTEEEGG